jgi:hypothetical protein
MLDYLQKRRSLTKSDLLCHIQFMAPWLQIKFFLHIIFIKESQCKKNNSGLIYLKRSHIFLILKFFDLEISFWQNYFICWFREIVLFKSLRNNKKGNFMLKFNSNKIKLCGGGGQQHLILINVIISIFRSLYNF